jgi:hypothetical protein
MIPADLPVIGSHHYMANAVQHQTSEGLSWLSDGAGPLFAMYVKIAEEQERKRVELLRGDTDQLLVFVSP